MNKEEIEERISYAKSNFTDGIEIFLEIIEKQQKELEQKESILDKVTEECMKQMTTYEDSILEIFPQRILNIIEGEKE